MAIREIDLATWPRAAKAAGLADGLHVAYFRAALKTGLAAFGTERGPA